MTLEFSRRFYSPRALAAARDAYAGCARIEVSERGDELVVVIDEIAHGFDERALRDEFGNRALAEMA